MSIISPQPNKLVEKDQLKMEKQPDDQPSAPDVQQLPMTEKVWIETLKLWRIAGPAILTRAAMYGMNVVTQAFVGHIGDLELAAVAIASTVVVGLNFGIMLGMASALETLCGQAFGAQRYNMLGIYLQRSWIILFIFAILLLPIYFFATPILKAAGQADDISRLSGSLSIWFIPQHFAFVFLFTMQRYLQCQRKNILNAWTAGLSLGIHIFLSWLFISYLKFGLVAAAVTLNIGWWLPAIGLFLYITCGGCPQTWTGFSMGAFEGLWEFTKLSVASGVMLCLENWYYKILLVLAGTLKDSKVAVDALSVCMNINGWELMIPLGFGSGTGVRVSNELGAGNAKAAKFATEVAAIQSLSVGILFCIFVVIFRDKIAYIFTTSPVVIDAVTKLSILLAFTILLNSVQPVLSGVAVGSGWQAYVAYINLGCYYLIGLPIGGILGWVFHLDVMGIWSGMIGGTAVQTAILAIITIRCDWEKEAEKARLRVDKWSRPSPNIQNDGPNIANGSGDIEATTTTT